VRIFTDQKRGERNRMMERGKMRGRREGGNSEKEGKDGRGTEKEWVRAGRDGEE
jgi:hypothetical protein